MILTKSLVPQLLSWTRMVNSSSPDGTAPHAPPSVTESEPSRRCLPSTWRPLSNMSACTTTSMESGWQRTSTRRAGGVLCCCSAAGNWGWMPPRVLCGVFGCVNLLSVSVETKKRTIIHQKEVVCTSILGFFFSGRREWRRVLQPVNISPQLRVMRWFLSLQTHLDAGLTDYNQFPHSVC